MPGNLGLDFATNLITGGDIGAGIISDLGGGAAIFGTKPKVAPFVPVDLSAETAKAVAGNLDNYPAISDLLNKIIPGFSDILAAGTQNTLSELHGELPVDVASQVQRSSAFQSLLGGFSGTPMASATAARNLGLTSLGLTQTGQNAAQLWSSIAEQAYGPFTVSTGQQASATAANNAGTQAQQQYQFNVDAAPSPSAAGLFALDQHIGDQFLSFGLGAAGGAIAGGGGSALGGIGGLGAAPNGYYNPGTLQYGSVPTAGSYATAPTWGTVYQPGGAG